MVSHILSIVAGLGITFWATVVSQYHEFSGPPEVRETAPIAIVMEDPVVSPLDTVVAEIARVASTSEPAAPSVEPRPLPTTAPSVPFRPLPVPATPTITPPAYTNPEPTPPPVVVEVEEDLENDALLRGAIVNIICLPGGGLRGASGSGVVVDPRGIIITVAHIAQNFLLTDYPTENAGTCYIRTGSPAKNAYSAELIYISSDWIRENREVFLSSRPTGTGENDFAFLAITGSLTGTPVSRNLSYIPLATTGTEIEIGEDVGIGSYAAEFLTSSQVRSSLYPTISSGPVNDVYTFGRSTSDIFSVRAGSAAQEGSSGGAVINDRQRLIGVISTRTVRPDLSMRDLQALTMNHVRRSFRSDMDTDLDVYLRGDLSTLVSNFEDNAEDLLQVLRDVIED